MLESLPHVEHLSDRDLELIAQATDTPVAAGELRSALRGDPAAVDALLSDERLFVAVFGTLEEPPTVEVGVSPYLVFAVLVHRVVGDLAETAFVSEWVGAGQRLPVFDVDSLREFADRTQRRRFLVEFLASFTKVASGAIWVRTHRGYRRRRFSELDPVSLATMVEALPPSQRAGGYRRLGDVALFLSGVLPDHTTRQGVGESARTRLARSAGVDFDDALAGDDGVRFFEVVGSGWYQKAVEPAGTFFAGDAQLRDVADNFTAARRFLNLLSDRYLHQLDTGLMHPAA